MARPKVTLPTPYLAQTRYERDQVTILKVDDDDETGVCRAFVRLGNNDSFKYWVPITQNSPTPAQIEAAVIAFFAGLAPAA